jgi:hypothetical protein
MDIINTMCRISDLTPVQKHNLIADIPKSEYFQWSFNEVLIGFDDDGDSGTWVGRNNTKIVTYTEMMQLLGKTMKEFTKSDLKTGMFVKYRSGDYRVVIGHVLSGTGCATLPQYSEDLKYRGDIYPQLDIVAVYKATRGTNIDEYLKGHCLTPIWERIEQTPAQKEMEVLQAKMDELQEQMKVVQAKL